MSDGILVGAVHAAAILDDAQPPRGDLLAHAVIEEDHAVADVFLDPVASERVFALFARDDGGDALFLQPAEQAAQFGPEDALVVRSPPNSASIVSRTTRLAPMVDGGRQADEEAFEVILAGFLDLAALDVDVVDDSFFCCGPVPPDRTQRGDVFGQFLGGLLKGHEDARLVELDAPRTRNSMARGSFRSRRRRRSAWAGRRQPAAGDLVETADAGGRLRQ